MQHFQTLNLRTPKMPEIGPFKLVSTVESANDKGKMETVMFVML